MCQSVKGAIRNWKKREWKIASETMTFDGKKKTPEGVKDAFLDMLSEGILYIPIGDCDNFDPKKGCLGHEEATK